MAEKTLGQVAWEKFLAASRTTSKEAGKYWYDGWQQPADSEAPPPKEADHGA